MRDIETVCAVVVTYNRKQLLLECLEALRRQTRPIQAMYIIDNFSSDGTPEYLKENGYITELPPKDITEPWEKEFRVVNLTDGEEIKVHYVRMNENTGGAGGFYEGVKRGYERGYDWLWLMDDDVEALPYSLETQLKYKNISQCIHPSKRFLDGSRFTWEGYICEKSGWEVHLDDEFIKEKDWTCVNYGCFEGMLINTKVVSKIGYPKKELFFIGDDTLWGYDASKYTNVIYIKDELFIKKIDKRGLPLSRLEFFLLYRNQYCYVFRKIAKNKLLWFIGLGEVLVRNLVGRIIKKEPIKIIDIFKGILHGIFEIWGGEKSYLKNRKLSMIHNQES